MRLLFWAVVLPLAVVVALFAVHNGETVTLDFDPLPYLVDLPLYAVVLLGVFLGMVVGGAAAWLGQGRWRRQARSLHRRVRQLEQELEEARTRKPALAAPPSEEPRRAATG